METKTIIIVVVVAIIVLALLALIAVLSKKKQAEQRHVQAESIRQEAAAGVIGIPDARAQAQADEARAEAARIEARRAEAAAAQSQQKVAAQEAVYEDQVREADRLDPQVKTDRRDYAPDTSAVEPVTTPTAAPATSPTGATPGSHTAPTPVDRPEPTESPRTQRIAAVDAEGEGETVTGADGRVLDTEGRPLADPLHSTGEPDDVRNTRTDPL